MSPKGDGLFRSLDPASEERGLPFTAPPRKDRIGLAKEAVDLLGSPTPTRQQKLCGEEVRHHSRLEVVLGVQEVRPPLGSRIGRILPVRVHRIPDLDQVREQTLLGLFIAFRTAWRVR
jgi:hypothetical protein